MTAAQNAPVDLSRSEIVDASAGTGKTREVVDRIVSVIAAGTPVEGIIAVTFTDAAAGQMKLRIRERLDQQARAVASDVERQRLTVALQQLDKAFIGTIHALCANILHRYPVEAGVDPAFQEIADADARRMFARVFRHWLEGRLASPSATLKRSFLRLAASEEEGRDPIRAVRDAAWRLVDWRDHPKPWKTKPFDRSQMLTPVVDRARALVELRSRCPRPGYDPLYQSLRPVADLIERLDRTIAMGATDQDAVEAELFQLPRDLRFLRKGSGPYAPNLTREAVVLAWEQLEAAIATYRRDADANFVAELRDELWALVPLYEQEKRVAGRLDFSDLLMSTRQVLVGNRDVRAELQQACTHLFVDEFQDTDPLQAEILLLLTSSTPEVSNWRKITPAPGKLFLAGDRKQSIYRFRRADVQTYTKVTADLVQRGVVTRELLESHRSTEAIQEFVNAAFHNEGMPNYLPLNGGPKAPKSQPSILALPIPEPYSAAKAEVTKKAIDASSPKTVAAFVEWLVTSSGWTVRERADSPARRPIREDDICILFRRFTGFGGEDLTRKYARCLEARNIAHTVIGSKSFHDREEVATIRAALRAIEWPEDQLSVFAVLHGGLFAIPDGTLLKFRSQIGQFHPFGPLPDDLDSEFEPVRDILKLLAELHRRRNHRPIVDTIHQLLEHARAHAGFAFRVGGPRVLANVYRLADFARAFETTTAISFRSFVDYLDEEATSGGVAEATVLEQDLPGVKLMTVHKAKGLEFPVVILADLTCKLTGVDGGDRWVDTDEGLCAQRLLGCTPWDLLEHHDEETLADREEAWRVAYVAATRARDLVVLCANGEEEPGDSWLQPLYPVLYPAREVWRISQKAPGCPDFGNRTVLNRPPELPNEVSVKPGLHSAKSGGGQVTWFDPAVLNLAEKEPNALANEELLKGTPDQVNAGKAKYHAWRQRKQEIVQASSRLSFRIVVATEAQVEAADDDSPLLLSSGIASRPVAGRTFGKLVHSIIQRVGPGTAIGRVEAIAAAQARRFQVQEEEIKWAVKSVAAVLSHPIIMGAAKAQRCYREYPVVLRLDDGRIVEGIIDLAYYDGNEWIVVDFKTGSADEERYRRQLSLYATAIRKATGKPVKTVLVQV